MALQHCKRCSTCGLNFPILYKQCYGCGGPVSAFYNQEPMDADEAKRMRHNWEFEEWLLTPEGRDAEARAKAENDERERQFAALEASLTHAA